MSSFSSLPLNLLTQLSSLLYSTYAPLPSVLLQTRLAELDTLDDFIANTTQFKSFALIGKIIDVVTKSDEEVSCQHRIGVSKSLKETCGLFENQVDEQTTARLGDAQQRKTTISTMVDNCLSEEILEVRLEHTPRAIYHALL